MRNLISGLSENRHEFKKLLTLRKKVGQSGGKWFEMPYL